MGNRGILHKAVIALLMLIPLQVSAYNELSLIRNRMTFREMRSNLVMDQKWVPYPDYKDREGWDKFFGDAKDSLIRRGEKVIDYEWEVVPATTYLAFERTGERIQMEKIFFRNFNNVSMLMFAELAEGKGRFINKLIDAVYMGAESPSWALSAHTTSMNPGNRALPRYDYPVMDLTSSDICQMYAWIYYFFKDEFDKVNPEISRRLRHELEQRVMIPYAKVNSFWWMARRFYNRGETLGNWAPWCVSGPLRIYMLLENNRNALAEVVWQSMETIDKYMNFALVDGACVEGVGYGLHSCIKLFEALESLSLITGGKLNLFDEPILRSSVDFISRSYIGNGWAVSFSDSHSRNGGGDPYQLYRCGLLTGSEEMKGYAALIMQQQGENAFGIPDYGRDSNMLLYTLAIRDEFRKQPAEHNPAPFTWFPVNEIAYYRSPEGMFLSAIGGTNGAGHNHNDVGSCTVYYNQTPFLIDIGPGRYIRQYFGPDRYTFWNTQSAWHNLPTINGVMQKAGKEYKATACKATPGYFSADISSAYPEEAKVKSWIRSYSIKGKEVTVSDDYELASADVPNEINFITCGTVDGTRPGVVTIDMDGQKGTLSYDSSLLSLKIDEPAEGKVFEKIPVTRIRFIEKKPARKGNHSFTFRGL